MKKVYICIEETTERDVTSREIIKIFYTEALANDFHEKLIHNEIPGFKNYDGFYVEEHDVVLELE